MLTADPVDARPVRALRAGTRLVPGHLAWRRLGVGHRGETWLTWSTEYWAPAVVKLPRPDQLDHPRARAALAREGDALAVATHPGLARLLDDRRDAAVPHLVLEWIDGPALDEVLDSRGPLPAAEVLALAAQLAAVLRRLHACGLAHLDLTPANVVVRDGWPLLVDLGAARPLGAPTSGPGTVGTAGYAAPELERGEPVSVSMDLYGLGAVLRDALAPSMDPGDPLGAVRRDALAPGTDGPLADVVATLLAPEEAARPASAEALLRALRGTAAGPPWPGFAREQFRG